MKTMTLMSAALLASTLITGTAFGDEKTNEIWGLNANGDHIGYNEVRQSECGFRVTTSNWQGQDVHHLYYKWSDGDLHEYASSISPGHFHKAFWGNVLVHGENTGVLPSPSCLLTGNCTPSEMKIFFDQNGEITKMESWFDGELTDNCVFNDLAY